MHSSSSIRRSALIALALTFGVGCHDRPTESHSTIVPLTLVADVQATGNTLDARILYHRAASSGTATEVLLQDVKRALADGTQFTQSVDLAPCLGDPAHVGGSGCEVVIQLVLLDAGGGTVDAVRSAVITLVPGPPQQIGPLTIGSQRLTMLAGDGQVGIVGSSALLPILVQLASSTSGAPLAARTLSVNVVSGGGSVSTTTVRTDDRGQATIQVVLGATPGANVFRVASTDVAGAALSFQVRAIRDTRPTIAAGIQWTCALDQQGVASCWGDNSLGTLGVPQVTTATSFPAVVVGAHQFTTITASGWGSNTSGETCAVATDMRSYCWGSDLNGELGAPGSDSCGPIGVLVLGPGPCAKSPVPVQTSLTFRSVSAGGSFTSFGGHTCGITDAGDAYCWGDNSDGQLGDGTNASRSTPVAVAGGLKFLQVSAAQDDYTCGLAATGRIYCWGLNGAGQFGNGTVNSSNTPVPVSSAEEFVAVATGVYFACGLSTTGRVWCWGRLTPNGANQLTPTTVSGPSLVMLTAGAMYVCGLASDGGAYCAGDGSHGALGTGLRTLTDAFASSQTLVPVSGGLQFTELSAGGYHTCGRTVSGALYCWGENSAGQLGSGGTMEIGVPVRVAVGGSAIGQPASIVAIGPTQFTGGVGSVVGYAWVRVSDAGGAGVPNVTVTFAGQGFAFGYGARGTTDASGVTFAPLILGPDPGPYTYQASVAALPNAPAVFTATGVYPGPVASVIADISELSGAAGATVPRPGVVVRDGNGFLIVGAAVTFTHSAASDATITPSLPATMLTDAFGHAGLSSWVLGTTAGADTVTATVTGSSAPPARIIVTTTAP